MPIFVEITPDGKEAYFSADLINPVTGALMVFDEAKNISIASVQSPSVPAGIYSIVKFTERQGVVFPAESVAWTSRR